MQTKIPLSFVFAFLMFSLCSNAQGFLHTQGTSIVDGNNEPVILRGMGLGGWMVQEGYMMQTASFAGPQHEIRAKIEELIGETATEEFYDAWLANHVRKSDIDSLKSWGFNSVRLPMHYNLYTLPIEDEPVSGSNTWLTKGFELTDSLLAWCAQNEMYLILDLHAAPGGQGYNKDISDYDPTKPSLWESPDNQNKTVALWRRLAERYANEPWIGGYDLINETNWDISGNTLRSMFENITEAIREVDNNHIIFIEGNWFANDFTGLFPPWDNNMVYSPHKYWNYNDQASVQWVIDQVDPHNVPIWIGETGENSNTWFRDAIQVMEANNIGWAWWPLKKIDVLNSPFSIVKTQEYQMLLDYWNGNAPKPSVDFATNALMELAEKLKTENCEFRKCVVDAMFRQINNTETIPYNGVRQVPGILYASDFDLGPNGYAYQDGVVADYHLSNGMFTAWNTGWTYRNDGVDIERCDDNINANGYSIGWIENDDWMQYEVEVAETGVYDVRFRMASAGSDGYFHMLSDQAPISKSMQVPNTGGWQDWGDVVLENVVLMEGKQKLRFHADSEGFNLSSMEFLYTSPTTSINTFFVGASTLNKTTISVTINKPLSDPVSATTDDFKLFVNGDEVGINSLALDAGNPRNIILAIPQDLIFDDVIKVSFTGNQVTAQDDTPLTTFTMEDVKNTLPKGFIIPGIVQAEDYDTQSGVQTETTTDAGGGLNVGFLDVGDFMEYIVNVKQSGTYTVGYRIASEDQKGGVKLQFINENGEVNTAHEVTFPKTGGWQSWVTIVRQANLTAGLHRMRIEITQPQFNINWIEFKFLSPVATEDVEEMEAVDVYPNPNAGIFNLDLELEERQSLSLSIYNMVGQKVFFKEVGEVMNWNEVVDISGMPKGGYLLRVETETRKPYTKKIFIH